MKVSKKYTPEIDFSWFAFIKHIYNNGYMVRFLDIQENNNHIFPRKMKEFLSKCNTIRNKLIDKNIYKFSDNEYQLLINEYDSILNNWEKELRNDVNNHLLNDEINLWTRMKYDNKKMDVIVR